MNEIKHHLSDQLLMAYAGGGLNEAFSLVVATHIEMCDDCRARLGAFEAVGGVMLDDTSEPLTNVDLDATFALIDAEAPKTNPFKVQRKKDVLPTALQDYVGGDLSSVKWQSVGLGVRQAILPTARDASARLLYIPAGTAVPDHGHRGTELTLVLQGAFADEIDHFGVGDLEIATEADEHTPVAAEGLDCICLSATDAPLKFNGLLQRLAQPFLKI